MTRVNRHFIPFGLFWALTEKALEKSISESLVKQLLSFLNGIGEVRLCFSFLISMFSLDNISEGPSYT